MFRTAQYGFPVAALEPGEEREISVEIDKPFRAERVVMVGQMDEIRGHFKIRHTRYFLNRENVIAYSNVTRYKSRRRTTVEYREGATGNFVRSYLPETVVYVHTDPLSYITLDQIKCDEVPAMPSGNGGANAMFFSPENLGFGFSMPPSNVSITITITNHGDIQVRVAVMVLGRSYDAAGL